MNRARVLRLLLIAAFGASTGLLIMSASAYWQQREWARHRSEPLCIQQNGNAARIWHPVKGRCVESDAPAWQVRGDDPSSFETQIDFLAPHEIVDSNRQFIEVPLGTNL